MTWRTARLFPPRLKPGVRLISGALLLLVLLIDLPAENPVTAAEDEADQRQELLPRYIPRHRRLRETLAAVDQLQSVGRAAEALKTVQWILDQPFDTLVFSDDQPGASVKGLAELKLRAFPAEWRQQYERTYGQEARYLLEEAKHRQDETFAVEVLRRFPVSVVADDAAVWLALRWLDQGDAGLAVAVLLPDEPTPKSMRDMNSQRLVVGYSASVAAGDTLLTQSILQELEGRTDAVAQAAVRHAARQPTKPESHRPPSETLTVPPDRDGSSLPLSRDAVPVLRPRWTAELPSRDSSLHLPSVLETWRGQLQDSNQTPVVPNLPLVVHGQVILRNYEGITGLDLASGRSLWSFPCETSISAWVDEAARSQRYLSDAGSPFDSVTLQWWFGSNAQLGYLSSDGIRIYAVDSLASPTVRQAGRQDPFQGRPDQPFRVTESNRLLALELPSRRADGEFSLPKLAWSYGRTAQLPGKDLSDRYFFGPPLPNAGRLLCLAETDREIRLMALQPETGAVLWEQPVAAADRAAVYDGERAFLACPPIVSKGLILCPTQVGVLAAVDAVTGNLRWSYLDQDLPPEPTRRPRGRVTARGRSGFAPCTVVHGNRVIHLPTASSALHCLELETGRLIWTQPRQRICSIAQVTDDVIVLLEDQGCRAVKLADGTDVWSQSLGPIVGTGLPLGTEYLVPLDGGRFALLESATGRMLSWQPTRSEISLGNLLACGDVVLSVNPFGVAAFPQAQWARRILETKPSPLPPADRLLLSADLNLAEGRLPQAEQFLDAALRETLPTDQQAEHKHLLRELLYQRLTTSPDQAKPLLTRLEKLAESPEERGRYLARQARLAVHAGDLRQLRLSLLDLSRLPVDITFASADDPGWRQSGSACCRQMLAEVDAASPEFVQNFRRELQEGIAKRDWNLDRLDDWQFALRVGNEDSGTGALRSTLAQRLEQAGRWHAAELLWLQNRHADDSRLVGEATAGFVRMWNRSGWPRDAALALRELAGPLAKVPVAAGMTGREFVEKLPVQHAARQWQQRMAPPKGRIRAVLIHSSTDVELPEIAPLQQKRSRSQPEDRTPGRYGEFARRLSLSEPLSAEVLLRAEGQQSKLVVIDKSTSQPVGEWTVPIRHSHPRLNSQADQGHFLPIGVSGELRGYSLLQPGGDGPVWTQRPSALDGRRAIPAIGPGGPTFVTFQAQNLLFVCDPWDGSILWQRDTLEPQGGLYSDPICGIAGDERCLIVFGQDNANYVLYDTLTGRALRTGRLELEPRRPSRWAYGRKVFSVTQTRGQWLVRGWDPWDDRWELEESMGDRNTVFQCVGTPEIAWLTSEGDLRIYDMARSQRTLNIRFPAEELEGFNALRVVTEGDLCFVNLLRNQQVAQTRDYNYPLQDALAPWLPHIRDDLYAIDRRTGKILWKRTVPNRTLLQVDPPGLPFLVLASMIRDAKDGNQRSLLVEVVDSSTGQLLGRQEHLPLDRIVNVEYDGVDQSLRIIGQHMVVQVQLLTEPATDSPDGVAARE